MRQKQFHTTSYKPEQTGIRYSDSLLLLTHFHIYFNICYIYFRTKSHGSGCTTALSGNNRYLYRVYHLTPPIIPSCAVTTHKTRTDQQWKHGGTESTIVPKSKIKGQCVGNTPNTLIIDNRPQSVLILIYELIFRPRLVIVLSRL